MSMGILTAFPGPSARLALDPVPWILWHDGDRGVSSRCGDRAVCVGPLGTCCSWSPISFCSPFKAFPVSTE